MREYKSEIEKLKGERIFSITKKDDGTFEFEECCDNFFHIDLNKEEVIKLINELMDLVK